MSPFKGQRSFPYRMVDGQRVGSRHTGQVLVRPYSVDLATWHDGVEQSTVHRTEARGEADGDADLHCVHHGQDVFRMGEVLNVREKDDPVR